MSFEDRRRFRSLTPLELERYCATAQFPMLRSPNLAVFSASMIIAYFATGALRFEPPSRPHCLEAAKQHLRSRK